MKKQQEHNKPEYPTEAHGAIPAFNNIEEEAEFWDTHDTTEFEDEFKPVKVRFARNLSEGFKVRFDPETANEIRTYAHEEGVGPTTFIRMLVIKALRQEHNRNAS
jgi:CopG antitoxin of type II toxin-antitoxin system